MLSVIISNELWNGMIISLIPAGHTVEQVTLFPNILVSLSEWHIDSEEDCMNKARF